MNRLDSQRLTRELAGLSLFREIRVTEETGSTNDLARALGREGAPGGLVVFAETQTAGRGRLGRRWESAPGEGLWFSILMRPALHFPLWTRLTTWVAIGIARAIEPWMPCSAQIKWPNDIYLRGRKVAGILIESSAGPDGFAVVGIGLNVNHTAFPEPIAQTATSLQLQAGFALDRNEVAAAVLLQLDRAYSELEDSFDSLIAEAQSRAYLTGRPVEIVSGLERIEGIAEGLDENGALVLRTTDGSRLVVASGEASIRL